MVTRRFSPELTRHAYPAGWMLMWWPMQAGLEDPITGGIETGMRISLKHEAMRAGNVSVTDIYNCSEVELRTMVERDRCLRAIRMGCSPRDIALRTPQTILQELWNAEERSAHAYYRSDRVSGVICSYEDLVGAGREPQGCSASSEDILLCAEDARERANCLQAIFAEIEKLPAGQRNIVRGVLVKGASQSDMARELGVSRAAVSKQLSTAVRKIRAAIRDESKRKRRTRQHHQFVKRKGAFNGSFQCYQSERKPVI